MAASKLARAKEFGATHGVDASKVDPVAAVKEITGGRGVDYAFVAVGSSAAFQQAFAMLARDGRRSWWGCRRFRAAVRHLRRPSWPSPRRR